MKYFGPLISIKQKHIIKFYSSRSAITGFTDAALRAGTYPATAPAATNNPVAIRATFMFISGLANNQ